MKNDVRIFIETTKAVHTTEAFPSLVDLEIAIQNRKQVRCIKWRKVFRSETWGLAEEWERCEEDEICVFSPINVVRLYREEERGEMDPFINAPHGAHTGRHWTREEKRRVSRIEDEMTRLVAIIDYLAERIVLAEDRIKDLVDAGEGSDS